MIVYDIHLIQPEDTDIELMSEELQAQLKELFTEYPSAIMYNSHIVGTKKIIHARIQYENLTEETLLALFIAFNLDWDVLGIRESTLTPAELDSEGMELFPSFYKVIKQIDKAILIPFMNDIYVDETTTRPVEMTDKLYLSGYSGPTPIEV